ncbi:hypothetical protein ABFP60_00120 [Clostridioides difficile]
MILRKKILITVISSLLVISLAGCSSNGSTTAQGNGNTASTENSNNEAKYVLATDLEFVNPSITEPDSTGTRYFGTQIKNNSKFTITGVSIQLELDNGETSYLSMYDTLLPGDTSSIVSCFGATTGNLEDMKAKTIEITMLDTDGKIIYVDYDVKLNKYSTTEGYEEEGVTSPVNVGELEFVNPHLLPADSSGTIYFETQIKNNSSVTLTGVSVELELDNGETSYLSTYDTLLSGDTSTIASCFGATTGNLEDMKAKSISITALTPNNKKYFIDYDVKLKKYDVLESVE